MAGTDARSARRLPQGDLLVGELFAKGADTGQLHGNASAFFSRFTTSETPLSG